MRVGMQRSGSPLVGWYGDDFTGATDTLATLAQSGLRAMLFLSVPTREQLDVAGELDAVGIAGATRAMSPDQIRATLAPVGAFFAALAPAVLHYKVCSTFDSARNTGNIVAAVQTLLPFVESNFVPIVGGQPNLGRYCVFSNLYARAGAQGDIYRIDRHPTMSRHPVTPMAEADLRVHLSLQGDVNINAIHYPQYALAPSELDRHLNDLLAQPAIQSENQPQFRLHPALSAVLLDVADVSHLKTIGKMIWERARQERLLAVGPSSVMQALLAHFDDTEQATHALGTFPADSNRTDDCLAPANGPVFVFAGSLSPVTLKQIEAASGYRRIAMDAQRLISDDAYRLSMLEDVVAELGRGQHTLVYTNTTAGGAIDTRDAGRVANVSATFVADVVARMGGIKPLRRVGIAGGDTSSQVTQSLDLWALSYQCTLAPGVTLCRTHSADPTRDGIELMLKGGQVGDEDLFNRFAL